ncbi:hypothetical protein [Dyella japonica]|uniref:Uncharacterized protein n=1 Tax=Dyella japonica A8 TaxID=1217721 RepID=A0A075K0L2_9GAMM|nr:hypothetical protein [Dyella japonica]AIF47886.1 hypothetical protein HY57_11735 [Dyella japonica A8]
MSEDPSSIFEEPKHVAVLRRLHLIRPEHRAQALRRVIIAIAVAWLPLALLSMLHALAPGHGELLHAFLTDIAVHARYLLAVPILILSEYIILPRLDLTARHFLVSRIIDTSEQARFNDAVISTRRLSIGIWPSASMTVLVYAIVVAIALTVHPGVFPAWHHADDATHLSLAGWWHMLVSLPLLLGLLLSWVWRVGVWTRFLHQVSRMNLHLISSHPDKAAGLQFVAFSPRMFTSLALTIGIITAGTFANEVFHLGLNPMDHPAVPIATAIVVVAIFISPPLVFGRSLLVTWRRGVFEYGALASRLGTQFEDKWLGPDSLVDRESLEKPDFSSTTDLYSVTANVYAMRPVLFDPRAAMSLAVATLLPFAPIWLSVIPAKVILTQLLKLVV